MRANSKLTLGTKIESGKKTVYAKREEIKIDLKHMVQWIKTLKHNRPSGLHSPNAMSRDVLIRPSVSWRQ
jgi:hypothetical protein